MEVFREDFLEILIILLCHNHSNHVWYYCINVHSLSHIEFQTLIHHKPAIIVNFNTATSKEIKRNLKSRPFKRNRKLVRVWSRYIQGISKFFSFVLIKTTKGHKTSVSVYRVIVTEMWGETNEALHSCDTEQVSVTPVSNDTPNCLVLNKPLTLLLSLLLRILDWDGV